MIGHNPSGRGHPYLVDPDQRLPLRPSGESFALGATTSEGVRDLEIELERAEGKQRLPMRQNGEAVPRENAGYGTRARRLSGGHLTETATLAAEKGRVAWVFDHEPLSPGERLRYRFIATDAEAAEDDVSAWYEVVGCSWQASGGALDLTTPPELGDRLVPESVCWLHDGLTTYGARFAIRLEEGERVVGFGERFNGLDQRGTLLETTVFDQYKGQGARSYLPMPFAIIVGGGFGFHLDSGYRARFDIGVSDSHLMQVDVDLEPGLVAPQLPLTFFAGEPSAVLAAFLRGRAPEPPPDWIYRLWMSGNEWNSQARVLAEVARSEEEGIPVGAIVIEAWSDEETFVAFAGADYEPHVHGEPHTLSDFTFHPAGAWPDPKGLVADLHARGVKVLLWQIPLAKRGDAETQAAYDIETITARGYCVSTGDDEPYPNPGGWFKNDLLIDFTSEEAVQWWLAKRRYLIDEVGVDGFKTDGGEHAWSPELRYADGSRGGETNNRYPVLYAHAYHELLRDSGKPPVTFSRAGYTGSQALPAHWAGDEDSTWEALQASVSAGLSASACGIFFWSFDLGGFSGPLPSKELYLRSAAIAALCPIMQYHSEFNFHRSPSRDRTPWNLAQQHEDETILTTFRRLAKLRERLVPYLVAEGAKSLAGSKPLMRALFFETADERAWDFPNQYFLGDEILVAPVLEEAMTTQRVFLPEGNWVCAWSGERVAGACVVERDAPIDQIPIFLSSAAASRLSPLFQELDQPFHHRKTEQLAEVS